MRKEKKYYLCDEYRVSNREGGAPRGKGFVVFFDCDFSHSGERSDKALVRPLFFFVANSMP